ncbi:Calcineurin-like phosphoesterase superfamily domain protein [Caloramator mitchellensis]|uniref:Calcineurin-like phosphoesterase superfamily domain protein n=1 Tax=Caloramator mitchellensis TaxID=908809 RepID=A0A0R3JX39_CALMK|nr:metallophosphoesterase [Caloramator mitchellensis]KRQ88088.1 Calcineurin-like phosphoesterase superfamily domain protein [Caloramator mitchellensis]
MKILLLSDEESKYIWDYFNPDKFKDIELVVSCGDLKAEYLSFIVTMIKAPLFYVHGNHDGDYLINPPEGCQCIDDKLILYKGLRIVGLGGSKYYNCSTLQYTEQQMERRITKLMPRIWWHKGFDILVTHAAAFQLGDGDDLCHQGFKAFNKLIDKYEPNYHFHGHNHLNYGKQERIILYKNTKIVNAFHYYIIEI